MSLRLDERPDAAESHFPKSDDTDRATLPTRLWRDGGTRVSEARVASGGRVQVRLLGPVGVSIDGADVAAGGPRQRVALVLLALHAGTVVSDDALAEAIWGDDVLDRSKGTLQVYISNLRKVLAPGGDVVIERRDPGYVLRKEMIDLDRDRFTNALDAGASALRSGDFQNAVTRFERGLAEHQGTLAADLPDVNAFDIARGRVEEQRLAALEDLIEAKLQLGRHQELVAQLESLVAEYPYRERLWGHLMLALYRCDRQADALDTYQNARHVLIEELGLEPGPALRALEQDILQHAPAVRAPNRGGPALHWVDDKASARRLELDPAVAPISIGRAADNDVALTWDSKTSRRHATLVHSDEEGWRLLDEGISRNGTFVNGTAVDGSHLLHDGDLVSVGDTVLLVRFGSTRTNTQPDHTTLTRGLGSQGRAT
jgi:DNA-binding SARP family transcriptional activator